MAEAEANAAGAARPGAAMTTDEELAALVSRFDRQSLSQLKVNFALSARLDELEVRLATTMELIARLTQCVRTLQDVYVEWKSAPRAPRVRRRGRHAGGGRSDRTR